MRLTVLALPFLALAGPLSAQQDETRALYDALRLDEVVGIMRDEGLAYGRDMAADLFGSAGGPSWDARLDDIYDRGRMTDAVEADFRQALDGVDIGPLLEFFGSPEGAGIIALEIEARQAIRDEAVEEAAQARAETLAAQNDPLAADVAEFIEVNDLVEQNVVGSLNSNFAFYLGLADSAADGGMSEDQMLAEVWAQEPEIRADTREWLEGYLTLAYAPADPDALDAYLALSRSDAGQSLNRAIFAAFDTLYVDLSRELGRAAGARMATQDL
ncbi:DUF2059 domain-containing protein [Palleronia sediminis]|nr:DUF2059 domain-containing protein [Palleronia sediminis]